jgi:hypothetical protein
MDEGRLAREQDGQSKFWWRCTVCSIIWSLGSESADYALCARRELKAAREEGQGLTHSGSGVRTQCVCAEVTNAIQIRGPNAAAQVSQANGIWSGSGTRREWTGRHWFMSGGGIMVRWQSTGPQRVDKA